MIKLAAGEVPASIPAAVDVRSGAQPPAQKIDGGPVDRILRELGGGFRASRVHAAAASLGVMGQGHRRFDDLEHATGLSRTLRIDLAGEAYITGLVESLSGVAKVEQVSPYYLCSVPMDVAGPALPFSAEEAQWSREQVLLVRIAQRLTLVSPGIDVEVEPALECLRRLAKAVGAPSSRYTAAIRL